MKKILLLLGASTLVSGAAACYTGIDASLDKSAAERAGRAAGSVAAPARTPDPAATN